MSSPACADGYDTPAQQREDSTTFMLSHNLSQTPLANRRLTVTVSGAGRPGRALSLAGATLTGKFSRQPERPWLTPRPGPGRLKAVLSQAERNLNKALNRGIPSSEPEIWAVHVPGTVTMMMSRD